MRGLSVLSAAVLAVFPAAASSRTNKHNQNPMTSSRKEKGVGHFSEWSRATKKEFLIDWQAGKESEWTFVMGNEGGDLDSMTAALTWAYHLGHSTQNTSNPIKAIALLQTPTHALDLRPENQLALKHSQMTSGHEDLLTRDELPEDPETMSPKLRGIVLVDHAVPLRKWQKAKILSIFDHHVDRGAGPDAEPRIFERTASCTTIVARQMLDELEQLDEEYHMPHELLQLILGAVAIDSSGLSKNSSTEADVETAKRVLKRSNWAERDLDDVMEEINDALSEAKKDLDDLKVRDLLRRDYKSDFVDTVSPRTPTVSLGFASVPYSLDDQIDKTEFEELFDWFAIHAAWTAEAVVDVSVTLNKYKFYDENGDKHKMREIVLVVRDDVRIDQNQATSLFKVVYDALTTSANITLKPWHRTSELAPRQMVWTHESDAGRKVIRPIVEDAVMGWDYVLGV